MPIPQHNILQCTVCGASQYAMTFEDGTEPRCTTCGASPACLAEFSSTCSHVAVVLRRKQKVVQCTRCGETWDASQWAK